MLGYLIDTQIVSYWFRKSAPQHANVNAHIRALPADAPLRVSVITIGEIAFGHATTSKPDLKTQSEFNEFISRAFPDPLNLTAFTTPHYGEIRSLLFNKYPPKGKKQRRPEQCFDPVTSLELGIDENDLWIASQAYERGLVLVTNDGMARIRDVAQHLVKIQDWTEAP